MYLGNISKDFTTNNLKQTGISGCVYDSSVDYGSIDADDILDVYKYLMKENNVKKGLDLLNKCLLHH